MELFSKSSPGAQKDEIVNANVRPKINSSILGAMGHAFNQAKNQEFSGNNISFQEKLRKVEMTSTSDQTVTSDDSSDSDETESSDSSITRVEQVKDKIKTGSKVENLHKTSIEVDKRINTADQTSKKARAKVSANMIISDFNNLQLQSKHPQEQYGNSSLISPTTWIETNNESGLNNTVRRPRVKASTTSEENISFQYKKPNIIANQPRKVSFDSNSDATLTYARSDTRSDVSWGSDPGKSPYNNNDSNLISPRQLKVRTDFSSYLSQYQNDNYAMNSGYNSTLSNNQKSWSDVTYGGPIESHTIVSHYSDPGPHRKIAQLSINNDVEDYEEENAVDADQEELEELIMSSDPKIKRKFLDLKIANTSLLSINATLEDTIKKQSSNLNTFESVTDVQQLQLDHMTKVEELMRELSIKISSQELEIKNLKNKLEDNSEQQQKSRVSLFYDPRNLPMNTLPSIIFDRVYEDITILFLVVVSLIYTIYILPIIVTARTAKLLADKSRAKILEITG